MYRPRQKQHHLEEAAVDALCSYFWPGNVRQLRHVIERLAATANDGDPLTVATVRRALPASANYAFLTGGADLHLSFYENDTLDDFLDRTMLRLYDPIETAAGDANADGAFVTHRHGVSLPTIGIARDSKLSSSGKARRLFRTGRGAQRGTTKKNGPREHPFWEDF
ncbi:hypothetical protein BH20ACI3_BH20ACI3_41500 [soil metagenome]